MSYVTFNLKEIQWKFIKIILKKWKVTLVDTGEKTMTGGRLKRVMKYIKNEESFCFTYGDGLGDINISELIIYFIILMAN